MFIHSHLQTRPTTIWLKNVIKECKVYRLSLAKLVLSLGQLSPEVISFHYQNTLLLFAIHFLNIITHYPPPSHWSNSSPRWMVPNAAGGTGKEQLFLDWRQKQLVTTNDECWCKAHELSFPPILFPLLNLSLDPVIYFSWRLGSSSENLNQTWILLLTEGVLYTFEKEAKLSPIGHMYPWIPACSMYTSRVTLKTAPGLSTGRSPRDDVGLSW